VVSASTVVDDAGDGASPSALSPFCPADRCLRLMAVCGMSIARTGINVYEGHGMLESKGFG
jgi:hypothetical protein